MNCSYRLGRLKRQQTSDKLRFLHRSYMRAKQNGGLLLREKQARQLSTCLSKPLTAQRCSHRLIEPSNHGTIERKISNRSRIWSAGGWCPAAIINVNYNYHRKISQNPMRHFKTKSIFDAVEICRKVMFYLIIIFSWTKKGHDVISHVIKAFRMF